jgi:hypothetical protein
MNKFIERTACVSLRPESDKSHEVPIDWAMEEFNKKAKHGNFQKGLPTPKRIENYILANDRITEISKFYKNTLSIKLHETHANYYDSSTNEMEIRVRRMLKEKEFGRSWRIPGEFKNLNGEVMDDRLEMFETVVAQIRNQKLDTILLGKVCANVEYLCPTEKAKG